MNTLARIQTGWRARCEVLCARFADAGLLRKFMLPLVVQAVLVAIFLAVFAEYGRRVLVTVQGEQVAFDQVADEVASTLRAVTGYVTTGRLEGGREQLEQQLTSLGSAEVGASAGALRLAEAAGQGRQWLETATELYARNRQTVAEILAMTGASIDGSDGYINDIVPQLADAEQRKSVDTLQRLALLGANRNSATNYEVQVLALQMAQDVNHRDALLAYLQAGVESVTANIERLAGTRLPTCRWKRRGISGTSRSWRWPMPTTWRACTSCAARLRC